MTVSVVLPLRKGSERLRNKNVRPFSGFQFGIAELKLKQLMRSTRLDEIVVSSNDVELMQELDRISASDPRVKFDFRPEHLCKNETPAEELIKHVASVCTCDDIMWAHATSPLTISKDYEFAYDVFKSVRRMDGYDSLLSVVRIQNHILTETGHIYNRGGDMDVIKTRWPRTQDLKTVYEPTHSIFISSREMCMDGFRVGAYPYMFVVDKRTFVDIDTEHDFNTAQQMFTQMYGTLAL